MNLKKLVRILIASIKWFVDPSNAAAAIEIVKLTLLEISQKQRSRLDAFFQNKMLEVELYKIPGFVETVLTPYNLDDLAQLPEGTLGKIYAEYMASEELYPLNFVQNISESSISQIFLLEGVKTHDLTHLLTGFDTSDLGEYGLLAFVQAQNSDKHNKTSRILLGIGRARFYILAILCQQHSLVTKFERITALGAKNGCKAKRWILQ